MPAVITTDLNKVIQVIVQDTVLTARHLTVMPNLIRRITMPEKKGSPVDLPKLGKLMAFSVAEGQDYVAGQQATNTAVTANPTETIVQSFITDRMLHRAPPEFMALWAEEHRRAWAEKMEQDATNLFSGFTNGLSAAGSSLTVGNLGAGRFQIRGNAEPGLSPYFFVLHPYQAWDVVSRLIPLHDTTTASYSAIGTVAAGNVQEAANRALLDAAIGRIFGGTVYESGLTIASGTDMYGIVATTDAMLWVTTDEGHMATQRDESARGTELNFIGEYDVLTRFSTYGYYFLSDATAPTS